MDPLRGFCGLDCHGCPIHLATLERDGTKKIEMRSEIARICKERYGLLLGADDINDCDGCHSERLFVTCAKCEIRKCAVGRNLESCAFCDQHACERLQGIFIDDPAARERLDTLRASVRGSKTTHS